MSAVRFFENYKQKGFHFSNKVLTKYCLSLYTKPFLILSGISGTGKTKIAQLFDDFSEHDSALAPITTEAIAAIQKNDGFIIMNVTAGVLHGDGRGNFKFSNLNDIFEEDEIPGIKEKIEELKQKGVSDNITEPEIFEIETAQGTFKAGIYLQRAQSPLLRVRFKSRQGKEESYDSQKFLQENYKEGDVLKLEKIGKRKLHVISKNDEAVRTIDTILQKTETQSVSNKLFISVKSNWTDSTEMFGYYNILEEKYNLTPVLKFLLTAHEHPDRPFFLLLDEMNLSKVEHYFSDFLSCLESRTIEGAFVSQEEMRLHNYSSFVESNDNYFDLVPNSIEIPLNLYVTGTVNIDETTYNFSPKVLDRANVIEFNDVDISSYNLTTDTNKFTLANFPKFGHAQIATSQAFLDAPDKYKNCVTDLLGILQPHNLHFGYRVINEMAAFINNSIAYIGNTSDVIENAIDIQIAQKILPKLNGSFGKLDEPLRKLIHYMVNDENIGFRDINIDYVLAIDFEASSYPESLRKISRLYTNVIYNGFASFLE